MKKLNHLIILFGIFTIVVLTLLFFSIYNIDTTSSKEGSTTMPIDIYMPIKSSRPGCEITDSCYIPSVIKIKKGQQITWKNDDVAFHSVTSGTYENPNGLFDSGHIDPGQTFTFLFDNLGEYDFFCTLHPWMKGKIIVEN